MQSVSATRLRENPKSEEEPLLITARQLCRKSGGDLEQIQFLLGHSSIQTTEKYLGGEQDIANAVNDRIFARVKRFQSNSSSAGE
jgi:integrase